MSKNPKPNQEWLPEEVNGMRVIRPFPNQWTVYVDFDDVRERIVQQYRAGYRDALEVIDDALDALRVPDGSDWRQIVRDHIADVWSEYRSRFCERHPANELDEHGECHECAVLEHNAKKTIAAMQRARR